MKTTLGMLLIVGLLASRCAFAANISATLTWDDNSNDEVGFVIERSVGTAPFVEVGRVSKDVATFKDENLLPKTLYSYRVKAYSGSIEDPVYSGYSNTASATTPQPPPNAPGSVAVIITVTPN